MPSDRPDDDMSNPAFSPRQLEQLDQRDEKRGFNAIQLEQLDARFVQQDTRYDEKFADLADDIIEGTDRALGAMAERIVLDVQKMLDAYLEDRDRRDRAVAEANANRLAKFEEADLPNRVSKLEAAVFPSKPQRRRRG